jgi:hypothetical protein
MSNKNPRVAFNYIVIERMGLTKTEKIVGLWNETVIELAD